MKYNIISYFMLMLSILLKVILDSLMYVKLGSIIMIIFYINFIISSIKLIRSEYND